MTHRNLRKCKAINPQRFWEKAAVVISEKCDFSRAFVANPLCPGI